MRWDQALIYAFGALLLIGSTLPVFSAPAAMIAGGCLLMALALAGGPRGATVFYRDVRRHIVKR